jgi:formiminotetrahydrofolate cyclodeaminase
VLADLSLRALLDELAAPREVPGAGSALAAALALGAATVQMAARLSTESWPEASGIAAQAEALRDRAAALVDEDAASYARALDALRGQTEDTQERRDWALGRATGSALEPPLALVRAAADLAELCREALIHVAPHVQADVSAAAALAAGVARGARELVAVNLTALPDDPRIAEADRLVALAEFAAETGP